MGKLQAAHWLLWGLPWVVTLVAGWTLRNWEKFLGPHLNKKPSTETPVPSLGCCREHHAMPRPPVRKLFDVC